MTADGSGRTAGRATVEDVAARAGVSTATVSRALNSPDLVRKDTRERVQSAVAALGYTPNFGARALAARRTETVAAVIPTLDNAIFARGLEAFQKELTENGITLLVASSSYRPEIEFQQVRTLVARGADAILLIGYDRDPGIYAYLSRHEVPYVVAWAHDPTEDHPSIGFDNRLSMRRMAEAVLAEGHVDLALVSAWRDGNDRARNRWLGVLDAMEGAGLDPAGLRMVETSYSIERGAEALRSLMASGPRPTAVLCGNDVLAAGVLMCARELGLSVPKDLSVTGFDDIEIARIVTPGLTTVHVPHRRMGQLAAQRLLAMRRRDPDTGGSEPIATEIVWRGSLAPPG